MTHICINSAPRTASRAVTKYFDNLPGVTQVIHAHYLIDKRISHFKAERLETVLEFGKEKWKVVTIVRDPIERNISDFWTWNFKPREPETFKRLFMQSIDHYEGLNHVAKEIEPFWGIDVYHDTISLSDFDCFQYAVLEDRLLIIHFDELENLDEAASVLLDREISGNLPHVGQSIYPNFMKEMKLPDPYVRKMLDHYYTKFFFTVEEREKMRERWSDGLH